MIWLGQKIDLRFNRKDLLILMELIVITRKHSSRFTLYVDLIRRTCKKQLLLLAGWGRWTDYIDTKFALSED